MRGFLRALCQRRTPANTRSSHCLHSRLSRLQFITRMMEAASSQAEAERAREQGDASDREMRSPGGDELAQPRLSRVGRAIVAIATRTTFAVGKVEFRCGGLPPPATAMALSMREFLLETSGHALDVHKFAPRSVRVSLAELSLGFGDSGDVDTLLKAPMEVEVTVENHMKINVVMAEQTCAAEKGVANWGRGKGMLRERAPRGHRDAPAW